MTVEMVVLDLGNVLVDWDPALTQGEAVGRTDWEQFVDRTDFWAFNRTLDAGRELGEARAWFAAHHGEDVAFLDRYIGSFDRSLRGTVAGMDTLVHDLLARGTRVGGLSNWPAELYHHATDRIPLVGALEDVVVSGFEHLRKPDPRIYRLMLTRFGVAPGRTVFVDDVEENVTAARDLGIHALRFSDATVLRAELGALGVL